MLDSSDVARQIYLWVDLPFPDETWASFLDRAARFYRCYRRDLISDLAPGSNVNDRQDFDVSMPECVHSGLLSALHVDARILPKSSRGITSDSLPALRRLDYCPHCFVDDLKARRTPYFRFQWAIPLLTHCLVHQTPLLKWRSHRSRDERILPWKWVAAPSLKAAAACPWLGEDLAFARQYGPSNIARWHPFSVVRRFSESIVKIDAQQLSWTFLRYAHPDFSVDTLLPLGMSCGLQPSEPLAAVTRPSEDPRLFAPAPFPVTWETDYMGRCWISRVATVGFRRSLLWFAARAVMGSRTSTSLVNNATAPAGSWENWWTAIVRPAAGVKLEARVARAEQYMRMRANHGVW